MKDQSLIAFRPDAATTEKIRYIGIITKESKSEIVRSCIKELYHKVVCKNDFMTAFCPNCGVHNQILQESKHKRMETK